MAQIKIKQISNKKSLVKHTEQILITNATNSLAKSLQDLTINFRKSQNVYLNSN